MSKWRTAIQSNKQSLLARYHIDDFDPDTRLYTYDGLSLVRYVKLMLFNVEDDKLKDARLEIPISKIKLVREELLDNIIEVLREKGANFILMRAGPEWGYTLDYVEEYEFEKAAQISRISEFNPKTLEHQAFRSH